MDGTSINNEKLINDVENNLSRNEIQIEENQINNSDIKVYEKELSFSTIKIYVLKLGNDYKCACNSKTIANWRRKHKCNIICNEYGRA